MLAVLLKAAVRSRSFCSADFECLVCCCFSGDATPCKMTGVTSHGVVSPEISRPGYAPRQKSICSSRACSPCSSRPLSGHARFIRQISSFWFAVVFQGIRKMIVVTSHGVVSQEISRSGYTPRQKSICSSRACSRCSSRPLSGYEPSVFVCGRL